jgi:aldehyde:ferredoxin oxidoreductase
MTAPAAGWTGRTLAVDLSAGTSVPEDLDAAARNAFLGGRGLNAWVLHRRLDRSVEPFGERNVLVFGAGPLVGTTVPSNGRYNVSSRSPLTGLMGDANAAGFWAVPFKLCGYDGLVVTGAADKPVYLCLEPGRCELCDAAELWGKTISETEAALKARHGQDAHVLSIGPGGENLVRYACIMNDLDRAAGRTGNGAVMGSKRLKAIVVRAQGTVSTADPQGVRNITREIREAMKASPSYEVRSRYGTPMLTTLYNAMGVLPTRNNQTGVFAGAERISGARLRAEYVVKPKTCYACPVHCSRQSVIREGKYAGLDFEGPEFEPLCSVGSRLGNDDLESILFMVKRLNDLGLDAISAGGTIAYAMECYEKGLIDRSDTDGLDLSWNNTESIEALIDRIAYRQGFGDLLAEGVRRAAERIRGSERYALHVKGMEVPTQEVRGLKAWGLAWAVASRGADHCRAFPVMETTWTPEMAEKFFGTRRAADRLAYEGKAAMVKWAEDYGAVIDALGLCTISYIAMGLPPELVASAYRAVTGVSADADQLLQAGERITNLERLLNLKLGLRPEEDTLPRRFVEEPLPEGPSRGEVIDIDRLVQEYYRHRGWDAATGYPTEAKLRELSLDQPKRSDEHGV